MPDPEPTPESLLELISSELGVDGADDVATPLLSSGFVDSFRVTALLHLIETHYGVAVDLADIGIDNFDTAEQMHRFVAARIDTRR
jgi:acyl carrier protein